MLYTCPFSNRPCSRGECPILVQLRTDDRRVNVCGFALLANAADAGRHNVCIAPIHEEQEEATNGK